MEQLKRTVERIRAVPWDAWPGLILIVPIAYAIDQAHKLFYLYWPVRRNLRRP